MARRSKILTSVVDLLPCKHTLCSKGCGICSGQDPASRGCHGDPGLPLCPRRSRPVPCGCGWWAESRGDNEEVPSNQLATCK